MFQHWGGPQWILATMLVTITVTWPLARITGYNRRPFDDWLGEYTANVAIRIALVALLYWGGFWS